ncbi:MAG: hypothetical protein H6733_00955 [Alphaproteobacteria bacterium]|nr:hypothetical protein [Alphaproteobacteria bacterium]
MRARDPWNRLLVVPALLALAVVWLVTSTWAARWSYPYDLEWMEGGVLAHAWRVMHAEPIYTEPGPDWIPMVYTPGYYYVLAVLGKLFGLSHALGRAVSIVGSLGAGAALIWGAHRRFGRPELGLIGAAIYFATYTHVGGFHDLVRPDALGVGLLAWALVLGTEPGQRARDAAAAALFAAFVVKHNLAVFGLPLTVGLWAWRGWRPALRLGLAAAVPGLLYTVFMQVTTHGHFLGFVYEVPASHPIVWTRVVPGTVREIGHAVEFVLAGLALWLLALGPRIAPKLPVPVVVIPPALGAAAAMWWLPTLDAVFGIPKETPFEGACAYALVGAAAVALPLGVLGMLASRRLDGPWVLGAGITCVAAVVAGVMRGHHGGYMNVFMPLDWVLAAAFVALLADAGAQLPGWRGALLATVLASAQLGSHLVDDMDLDRYTPDANDVEAGDRVVAWLTDQPGPMLSPFAPWIAAQSGHAPSFHLISLWDINHKDGPYRDAVDRITAAFGEHHWATVVDAPESMGYRLPRNYRQAKVFSFSGRALLPRSGWRRRPGVVWVPLDNARDDADDADDDVPTEDDAPEMDEP